MYLYVPRMVFTSNEIRIKKMLFFLLKSKGWWALKIKSLNISMSIFLNSAYNSFAYNQVNPTFGFIN